MIKLKENKLFKYIMEHNVVIILILVFIAAVLTASPKFTRASNFFNLFQSIGTYGILAIGLTFIFLVGGIDLSIGYQVSFCGTVFAILAPLFGLWPAIVLIFLLGCALGYINGTIVTRLKIPSLIGTLAVMTTLKGFVLILNNDRAGQPVNGITIFGGELPAFYNMKLLGLLSPSVIIALIMLAGFAFFLKWTRTGANMYITGGNPEAGAFSGINNERLTRLAYSIGGFCSAVCAVLTVFRNNSSMYNMGDGLDITAICAVVIGGIKMSGGKANMSMCIMGVAVIQIINNVMMKLGLHSSWQSLITGTVVILVLMLDKLTSRRTV